MTHFNQGVQHGLSEAVKNKTNSKHDRQAEENLRNWIEEVTGLSIGTDFQWALKNGIILCELINKLQPGSVKVVNISLLNWPQLENISNFIKAIQAYGLKSYDIFEANDLFENKNMPRVRSTLVALAGLAKTKGFHKTIGSNVKQAEKLTSCFNRELTTEQSVIDMQMGTSRYTSPVGMTACGTRDSLYDPQVQTDKLCDRTEVGVQMDTNKGAGLAGMLAHSSGRDICDQKLTTEPQMGTHKVASPKGMNVCGLGQQAYDPKFFTAPVEPVIPNGSQGTGTNESAIRDSDYQAEFAKEYRNQYQKSYPRDYQYCEEGNDG